VISTTFIHGPVITILSLTSKSRWICFRSVCGDAFSAA